MIDDNRSALATYGKNGLTEFIVNLPEELVNLLTALYT